MTINLTGQLEERLRRLAAQEGRPLEVIAEEAIRRYLDAAAISDLDPADVGVTQMRLVAEMKDTGTWSDSQEPSQQVARMINRALEISSPG